MVELTDHARPLRARDPPLLTPIRLDLAQPARTWPDDNRRMEPAPSSRAEAVAAERAARLASSRLSRELDTIAAMLRIYCHDHHAEPARGGAVLCSHCDALLAYARKRLAACVYGPEKPTCVNCPIHCYGRRQRETVRAVMRYAGPRMLWRHPWLAIAHLVDGRRPAPPRPGAVESSADPASPPMSATDAEHPPHPAAAPARGRPVHPGDTGPGSA